MKAVIIAIKTVSLPDSDNACPLRFLWILALRCAIEWPLVEINIGLQTGSGAGPLKPKERTGMDIDDLKDNDREKKIKDLHVRIPWALAERLKRYGMDRDISTTNVAIKALVIS